MMSNVIFNTIWNDKDMIIDVINKLITETVNEKDYNDEIEKEIQECTKKIENNEKKNEKLLDMYLNEFITNQVYVNKKIDIDENIKLLKERISNLESKRGVTKEHLETKLSKIIEYVKESLDYEYRVVNEDMIDSFVDSIRVYNNRYEWKLSFLKNVDELDDVFLTRIIINNDDVEKFKSIQSIYKKVRLKNSIAIDVYI